jgi:proliferating cell nuclear antigen
MFEARLLQGHVLKRVVESVKDLLTEAAWECGPAGIQLMVGRMQQAALATAQAMDDSHVSLVTMELRADGFNLYRCDRTVTLGMSLPSLGKIFK